jgi:hypothetical protein
MSQDYAGGINNITSTRIGQMDGREGQDDFDAYEDTIYNGGRELTARHLQEGNNVWVESVGVIAKLGIIDYPPPTSITYPNFQIPEIAPLPPVDKLTCGALWTGNDAMSAYENAVEENTLIVGADTSPCWTITCADMWALFPEYSANEEAAKAANEVTTSGGTTSVADCWDIQLNCNSLYELYPEWDKYKVKNAEFPVCWDVSKVDSVETTCADYYAKYNTPTEFRSGGVYPDCIKFPDPFLLPPNFCRYELEEFSATPDSLTFNVVEGYNPADTAQSVHVTFRGRFHNTAQPADNFVVSTASGLTLWTVDYSYRTRLEGTCRDQIDVIYIVKLVKGLTDESP